MFKEHETQCGWSRARVVVNYEGRKGTVVRQYSALEIIVRISVFPLHEIAGHWGEGTKQVIM